MMFYICVVFSVLTTLCESTQLKTSIFPPLPPTILNTENSICKEHSDLYTDNLKNFTLWAYQMWDSTAKSPSGVLSGSVFQMGHFEQCLHADAPFLTQYCLVNFQANIPKPSDNRDPLSLHHDPNEFILSKLYPYKDKSQQVRNFIQTAWCIPASCTPSDSEIFLNGYINELDLPLRKNNVSYTAKVSEMVCHTKEDQQIDGADIGFCLLTAILVIFVIASTFYDFNAPHEKDGKPLKKSLLSRLFLGFSAKRNFHELTKMDDSNKALTILYGMRTICILCIVMDHRFGTFVSSALLNFDYVEEQYRGHFAPFIFHGDLFVDSFFLLSGLLVAYGLLGQFEKKKRMNPGFIIFMRYIRLTPVYAFVIFYYATVLNYSGSGPLWKLIVTQDSQDCKDNWWLNILYVSNYVNADHMCMVHSWYLPCDFHYFIIGIGVCLLIKKEKKLGLISLVFLTILSIIIPFVLTIVYMRPALLYFYPDFLTGPKAHPDFLLTYSKSHTRATPYFIGMIGGYIYYKWKGSDQHICRVRSYVILLASIFLILISIIGGSVFYDPYHRYNPLEAATYAGLHRVAFAIGSLGVLYVASYGHASFIYAVLTWNPWIPLSKLVYGVYLIHMQFQLRSAAKFQNPRQISYFDVISLSLSDMVLAFIAALGLYLTIEAPFRKIFRELLMPKKVSPPPETNQIIMTENVTRNGNCDSRL